MDFLKLKQDLEEHEFTLSIQIDKYEYDELINLYFKHSKIYFQKIFKNDERALFDKSNVFYQRKNTIYKKTFNALVNNFFIKVYYKHAVETPIKNIQCWEKLDNVLIYFRRHYFYKNNLRFALDKHEQGEEKYFLHIEMENCLTLYNFIQELYNNRDVVFKMIEMTLGKKCLMMKLLEQTFDLTRPFKYINVNNEIPVYYAPKLDGLKYMCLFTGDVLIIPEQNIYEKISFKFNQDIIGCVEIVAGVIYIIDLCIVLSMNKIYCELDHISAIEFLKKKNSYQ